MNTATYSAATSNDSARFFDRFAEQFDTLYDGRRGPVLRWLDRRFRSDMFVRFALTFEVFGDLKDRTVLDVGCGSGPYMVEALRLGARHVTGLDPAEGMLKLSARKLENSGYQGRFTLVQGLFPDTKIEEPHDHAIVMGVMDYVADAQSFLTALKPLVRVSAAVSFPSRHWFRTPLRVARYKMRQCPLYFYDEDSIRRLARNAGFGSVSVQKISGAGLDYHACLKP